MDSRIVKIIINQAEIIFEQAKNCQNQSLKIHKHEGKAAYADFLTKVDALITQYNYLVDKISKVFKEEGIDESLDEVKGIDWKWKKISEDGTIYPMEGKLLSMIFGAGKILCFLREGIVLPEQTINRLSSLTNELEELKNKISLEIYNNLKEAKDEFEKGAFLGCSLISGRVIRVCLEKIPGEDINKKIEYLKDKELIRDKDGRDIILKADHFGRNVASHDLSIFPTSSEAISFLAESIRIAKIISNLDKELDEKNIMGG